MVPRFRRSSVLWKERTKELKFMCCLKYKVPCTDQPLAKKYPRSLQSSASSSVSQG